jgi:divalent metal cation (Fe/Co/Zn/Cd) transporter
MSAMNFYAIGKASEPADDEHRYGHGKAEDLAGVFQSVVIVLSGSFIIGKALQTFLQKGTISYSFFDFFAMCVSLVFSFVISTILLRTGKRTGSAALKADALQRQIKDIINGMSFPMAGFHKLRTRHAGSNKYIDFHLLACRKLHIDEAHALAHRIEDQIKTTIPLSDVIVHVEPCKESCDLTEITCVLRKK